MTKVTVSKERVNRYSLYEILNHSRRFVVSYKGKYVHEVLINWLFKLAQEKVWLGEMIIPPRP